MIQRFIHDHYDAEKPDAFGDEAFKNLVSLGQDVSPNGALVFNDDALMYKVEGEFPIDGYVLHAGEHVSEESWAIIYPRDSGKCCPARRSSFNTAGGAIS